jgi:hypothetical protein
MLPNHFHLRVEEAELFGILHEGGGGGYAELARLLVPWRPCPPRDSVDTAFVGAWARELLSCPTVRVTEAHTETEQVRRLRGVRVLGV